MHKTVKSNQSTRRTAKATTSTSTTRPTTRKFTTKPRRTSTTATPSSITSLSALGAQSFLRTPFLASPFITTQAHFSSEQTVGQPRQKKDKKQKKQDESLPPLDGAEGEEDGAKEDKKKDKKPARTWLLVHADIEFRNITGALTSKKVSNNADRKKARQDQMRDLLVGQETIEKVIPALRSPQAQVWYRRHGEKMAPQLVSISEAYELAKQDGEWNQIAVMKSSASNPPIPDHIRGVENDGIIPCWSLNLRDILEGLYEKDTDQAKGSTMKEVQVSTTITPDDLLRKIQQGIEFLFEGSSVRFMCNSHQVKKLATWVDGNTYFTKDEIKQQTEDALVTGKVLEGFDVGSKAAFQVTVVETRLKAAHPQKEGETDGAYKLRLAPLLEQERTQWEAARARKDNEAKQKRQLLEGRLQQAIDRLSADLKTFNGLLDSEKTTALKVQREISLNKGHAEFKEYKALKGGQFLPRFQKKITLLNKQIEAVEKELGQWRKSLLDTKKGMAPASRIQPYTRFIGTDGVELSAAQASAANRKAAQDGGLDFNIMNKVVMGGKGTGPAGDGDDGDGGGGDDGDDIGGGGQADHGVDEEEKLATRSAGKMSKKQLEEKKMTTQLEKLTAKERVQYLANVMSKQTYEPIGQIVDALGKISTIIQMERVERKKQGISLNHDEISPAAYEKLSNKERKRYDAKVAATRADPNAGLKLEIENAIALFQKGRYIYNDVVLEQQTKKPFWCQHDGGATPNEAKQKAQLAVSISKSALQTDKK